jgi:hypothetical protein
MEHIKNKMQEKEVQQVTSHRTVLCLIQSSINIYKLMCVCLYSMDSKTIHLIIVKIWEIIRYVPGKVFANFLLKSELGF